MLTETLPATLTVLIIDDDVLAVHLLDDVIADFTEAEREIFTDPREAVRWIRGQVPDLVITDFEMPAMNGLEIIRMLRQDARTRDVPILMLTGVDAPALRLAALESGANDFIQKPFEKAEIRSRVRNMLALREGQIAQANRADALSIEVDKAVAQIRQRERETILRLARAAEFRDSDTHAHLLRIADYAGMIAKDLGWAPEAVESLVLAAPMHDVGKIGIPDEIIRKPGTLEPAEYEVMKTHTTIGHSILAGSSSPLLELAAEIALAHHEHWDGGGYPQGVRGSEIPLAARIVAVADVFDALTSARPYKRAWSVEEALEYIGERAGSQFDPECAESFLTQRTEVMAIVRRHRD